MAETDLSRDEVPDPDRAEQRQEAGPGPRAGRVPDDPEVPEADAFEQSFEDVPGELRRLEGIDPEVPEADALEQATELPADDEEL